MDSINSLPTRIGNVIEADRIPSLTGSRDIGGMVVTRSGRVVIAGAISDLEPGYPFKIIVRPRPGETFRESFVLPAQEGRTYHTVGLSYDAITNTLLCLLGQCDGAILRARPYGPVLPYCIDHCGDNHLLLLSSRDEGDNWDILQFDLDRPEIPAGQTGPGVVVDDQAFIPHVISTCDSLKTSRRFSVYLARITLNRDGKSIQSGDCDLGYRQLASPEDNDILFANETQYIEKVGRDGYLSFSRHNNGPPFRREYDLDHRPTGYWIRCVVDGFDRRDYCIGNGGPKLVAFGISRLADGNLLCASRYYSSDHHRGGNIFVVSRDEGRTWDFDNDYLPWTLDPLQYPNSGFGGNPQLWFAPDGSLYHNTSEQLMGVRMIGDKQVSMDPPPEGGFALCRFEGLTVTGLQPDSDGHGTFGVDISTMPRLDPIHISQFQILSAEGLEHAKADEDLVFYSSDATKVSFNYRKIADNASFQLRIVLGNHQNDYRPAFCPTFTVG